jgi:hypothetical protein
MMKLLKWFVFVGFYLLCGWATVAIYDSPPIVFVLGGLAYFVAWFIYFGLPELQKDRQPMAAAKSGGWEPPRNWNHRPDGMKPPEPPPGPPIRYIDEGVRIWPDSDNHATWGPRSIKRLLQMEKQDLDRRAKSLSDFIGLSEAFDQLDPVEQDLLRHQCEHMWSYSEVLGARIANWRDEGPAF